MTLPASGSISFSQIATELGISGSTITLTQSDVRTLAGVPSGAVVLPDDFYGKSSSFAATINLSSGSAINLRTVADSNGYNGAQDAEITFKVPNGVVIRGAPTALATGIVGIDSGTWPGSYTTTLTLIIETGGIVDGGGGAGGSAIASETPGEVGPGGTGGHAINLQVNMTGGITINSGGTLRGGGDGGDGGRSRLIGETFTAAAGGGGGAPNGTGGAGMEGGLDGSAGTTSGGGAPGAEPSSGTGVGTAGDTFGTTGFAVKKNGFTATVTNNGTMIGSAA